jgi:hypothetical protein
MIAFYQSGMLNFVSALSVRDLKDHLQGIGEDQILRALESLRSRGIDEQWLQGIDQDQLLRVLESLDIIDDDNGINVGPVFIPILVIFGAGDEMRGPEN